MEKEFSLRNASVVIVLEMVRKPSPQATTPPAFLFLISYDVKQLEPKLRTLLNPEGSAWKRRLIRATEVLVNRLFEPFCRMMFDHQNPLNFGTNEPFEPNIFGPLSSGVSEKKRRINASLFFVNYLFVSICRPVVNHQTILTSNQTNLTADCSAR
ncbi:MAG: hypothetical protein ACRBEQ_02260 [Hyphomonas sp.]